jgi:hypothetical protein
MCQTWIKPLISFYHIIFNRPGAAKHLAISRYVIGNLRDSDPELRAGKILYPVLYIVDF